MFINDEAGQMEKMPEDNTKDAMKNFGMLSGIAMSEIPKTPKSNDYLIGQDSYRDNTVNWGGGTTVEKTTASTPPYISFYKLTEKEEILRDLLSKERINIDQLIILLR